MYYLNAKGKELVGSEKNEVKWNQQVDHILMRNDIWLFYYGPKDWKVEVPLTITSGLSQVAVVPDAIFTLEGKYYFVEIDNTQKMTKNKDKIDYYARINPLVLKQFNHAPVIVFYTANPTRKEKLKELCQAKGLDCRIYTKEDLV